MRVLLLVLCFACAAGAAPSTAASHHENLSGRIVAYSTFPACLNGNGYWSMIIRVEQSKDANSKFIRVDFSLPCGKSPDWVSVKSSIQKFRLVRKRDCDEVLAGSLDSHTNEIPKMPVWSHTLGAEDVMLPFGKVVPCYHSIDLPWVPVV